MIAVIDYRAGNITSVVKAFAAVGAAPEVTSDPEVVRRAEKVVLPGVGHFAATRALARGDLDRAVRESIAGGTPFLGICVGLQWLFEGSEEADEVSGLGLFKGRCERFAGDLKVPHVGWNSVEIRAGSRMLRGVESGAFVYYTHSYRAPQVEETVAVTEYGGVFTAVLERSNVFGIQFHPEKSGGTGLRVLRNFLELNTAC